MVAPFIGTPAKSGLAVPVTCKALVRVRIAVKRTILMIRWPGHRHLSVPLNSLMSKRTLKHSYGPPRPGLKRPVLKLAMTCRRLLKAQEEAEVLVLLRTS